jgi:hypothetical protein
VTGASLDNGLLNVDLRRPLPETKVRTIAIKPAASKANGKTTIDVASDVNA